MDRTRREDLRTSSWHDKENKGKVEVRIRSGQDKERRSQDKQMTR